MHHRNMMFVTEVPSELEHPVGRWWCAECDDWATDCEYKDEHQWSLAWREREEEPA